MEQIWKKACSHYAIPEDVVTTWLQRIEQRLSEPTPSRVYHNWDEMLMSKRDALETCKPSVVLAAFFQYYTYDGNRCCVQDNCATFKEFCQQAQIEDEETKSLVLRLLGDKTLDSELESSYEADANLLQDLDLIVLGAPAEGYQKYTQLLRREYAHLDEEHYKQMRLRVLEALLMIPSVYSTTEFREKYEETARQNIKAEIAELKAK